MFALTLLWHPELARAGQQALLGELERPHPIGRHTPLFREVGDADGQPLEHPTISRSPMMLTPRPDGSVLLHMPEVRMRCEVNGEAIGAGELLIAAAAIDRGAVLQLGGQVVLCLHRLSTLPQRAHQFGLVGVSSAMTRLRRQVAQVAPTDMPVLILGESGTGKELVAQAVHAASTRHRRPMVSVNMAALSESLAMADLFGAARGAYTGAQAARKGLIAEAAGGTLFLDEIGDAPATVQPMLLRTIETGEYRALGSTQVERADVRLIAATDRDLSAGNFNQPLLRRLEAFVIRTPPLRERREDIGVLIAHRLESELGDDTWPTDVPAALTRAICLHDWPGNVRQLGHAVRRLVLAWRSGAWPSVEELIGQPPGKPRPPEDNRASSTGGATAPTPPLPAPAKATTRYRAPSEIGEDELRAALDAAAWQLQEAAAALRVSRPSLYNLLERQPWARRPEDLPPGELAAALAELGDHDLGALATRLRTPREALRRWLKGAARGHAPGH